MFGAIAFAGGGNRCYWQGGFWEAATARLDLSPRLMVGVSGGAFAACYSLAGIGARVRREVIGACAAQRRNVEWRRALAGRSVFPVGEMYVALLGAMFGADELTRLRAGPEILIQVSYPPARLPVGLATVAGLVGYQVERTLTNRVHPKVGRALGFVPDWISTHRVATPAELATALAASSSVPPFMAVGRWQGRVALDGGLVDNVPVDRLGAVEAAGERTLVLATRVYGALPDVPNRTYVQPSEPIRVDKFSVTDPDGIREAYELGLKDGAAFAARVRNGSA